MNEEIRKYHFDFIKDRFWIWAIILPVGLICWILPFIIFRGLQSTGLERSTSMVIAYLFLGLPSYLIGWIFIYSFMEGLVTRVTFSTTQVTHRTPWKIFPLFWVINRVEIDVIESINMQVPYGTRYAIFLYYRRKNKVRKFYLPRFNDQPNYLKEFDIFQSLLQ